MNIGTDILNLIKQEQVRQTDGMELIPSENYVSKNVLTALGSILTNKYSEGYPGARYYGGQEVIDRIEQTAIDLCKQLFKVQFVNVQPYSGTPANLAVYTALLEPGDTILSMALDMGGHLSHGFKITLPGKLYNVINYGVAPEQERTVLTNMKGLFSSLPGYLDYEEIEQLAKEHKPKMIIAGGSAYSRIIDFARFKKIADTVEALLFVDMAHIAGLVAAGVHPSPIMHADVVSSTTHKTLRGPRGGLIMTNNEEYAKKIAKAVFPGIQGGPHDNNTAAKAICFAEALKPDFTQYAKAVVKNAQTLARILTDGGAKVISGGTDNHLMMVDVTPLDITGKQAQELLDTIGITVNKQMLPRDTRPAMDPSGIRLGSPAMTTRGFGQKEFEQTGQWILETLKHPEDTNLHQNIRNNVRTLCQKFPLPSDC